MLRTAIRHRLEKVIGKGRLEDHWGYQCYLRLFRRDHFAHVRAEREFCRGLISESGNELVSDVGANHGHKARLFSQIAKKVVCIEPGVASLRALHARFDGKQAIPIVPKGVGPIEGFGVFHEFGSEDAFNTFSEKWSRAVASGDESRPARSELSTTTVPLTTLDQLISEYGLPGDIKIDVEGYELPALKGLTLHVPLIRFECKLPEFEGETVEAVNRLILLDPAARFNFCTTEPPVHLAEPTWLSAPAILEAVTSRRWRFMEVYCRMNARSAGPADEAQRG